MFFTYLSACRNIHSLISFSLPSAWLSIAVVIAAARYCFFFCFSYAAVSLYQTLNPKP